MSGRGSTLAWLGLGVGIIGIALTLRQPTHIPPVIFWLVLVPGIGALAVGLKRIARNVGEGSLPTSSASLPSRHQLLATECERFSEALIRFIGDQLPLRPRSRLFAGGTDRERLWNEQVSNRYRRELRTWGLEIFDAAVRLDGVDASSRVFVDAPSPTQMDQLPDLFRDAARSLNRHRQ